MARAYLATTDPRSPLASPLFADLAASPPLDPRRERRGVARRRHRARGAGKAAGVDATLEQWDRMIHVWHGFLPMLDEAQAAVASIGSFVRTRTA